MNKKLITQYGEDILSYRLRTARQKKRMQYEDFDKQLRGLHRERKASMAREKALGWEPLTPPVQRGWKRSFVLRDDVARSKHANFFEAILGHINTEQFSSKKDFTVKSRKLGRKIHVPRPQQLNRLSAWEFNHTEFTPKEKQCFNEVYVYNEKGDFYTEYEFTESWRFRLRKQPNIIDKIKVESTEQEARDKEIDNYLERNGYEGRYKKVVYGHGYKWGKDMERAKEVWLFKNKSLAQILDLIND